MNRKVLLIYTGGTIGMVKDDQGFRPLHNFELRFRQQIDQVQHQQLPDFDLVELHPLIDSSNLLPEHWQRIAGEVIKNYEQYDGFVILHGTDTMAYSSSMLSYLLQGLDKPVIFTGSQLPLNELRSDALDNLITSLLLAGFHPIHEVALYFHGRLLRGNRCTKIKATGMDAFDSPNYPWLGQVGVHIELHQQLLLDKQPRQFSNPRIEADRVALLTLYPGIPDQIIEMTCKQKSLQGLVIQSYGVGNLPDQNTTLNKALHNCAERDVVMLNTSNCLQAKVIQGYYATSAGLDKLGVIAGGDMTVEAALTKLQFLTATVSDVQTIRQLASCSLAGEID